MKNLQPQRNVTLQGNLRSGELLGKLLYPLSRRRLLAIIFEGGSEEDAASLEQGQGASGEAETLGEKAEIKRWAETMKASKSKRKQGCSAKMKSTSEVLKTELTKLKSRLKRLEWVEYELKIHVEPRE